MVLRVVFADDNFLVREGSPRCSPNATNELVDTAGDPNSLFKSVAETS